MKHVMRKFVVVGIVGMVVLMTALIVQAGGYLGWPAGDIPLVTASYDQQNPQSISDGNKGAITVWQDFRSGNTYDIYAQRVNLQGQIQWPVDGVALSTASDDQINPSLASDGQNGAIVTWQDKRNGNDYDIYVQRISAKGAPLWLTQGVTICATANTQDLPRIVSDGQGGAIIVWEDYRSNDHWDVYAQRVDARRNSLWTPNGIKVTGAAVGDRAPVPMVASDGQGGVLIAWMNQNSSPTSDVWVQRLSPNGQAAWGVGGIKLTSNGYSLFPRIVSDDAGGAIVTWELGGAGVMGQRVLSSGKLAWGTTGITLSLDYTANPQLLADEFNGAFVAWQTGLPSQITVQHVQANGMTTWGAAGITLTTATDYNQTPQLVSDGFNGVIVEWQKSIAGPGFDYSLWAQRINQAGVIQWTRGGVQITPHTAYNARVAVTTDMSHGAIVSWEDQPAGTYDLYAQRIYNMEDHD